MTEIIHIENSSTQSRGPSPQTPFGRNNSSLSLQFPFPFLHPNLAFTPSTLLPNLPNKALTLLPQRFPLSLSFPQHSAFPSTSPPNDKQYSQSPPKSANAASASAQRASLPPQNAPLDFCVFVLTRLLALSIDAFMSSINSLSSEVVKSVSAVERASSRISVRLYVFLRRLPCLIGFLQETPFHLGWLSYWVFMSSEEFFFRFWCALYLVCCLSIGVS